MMRRNESSLDRAPKRRAVLEFIKAEIGAGRPFPSYADIALHMSWANHTSARDAVSKLHLFDKVLDAQWDKLLGRRIYSLKEAANADQAA